MKCTWPIQFTWPLHVAQRRLAMRATLVPTWKHGSRQGTTLIHSEPNYLCVTSRNICVAQDMVLLLHVLRPPCARRTVYTLHNGGHQQTNLTDETSLIQTNETIDFTRMGKSNRSPKSNMNHPANHCIIFTLIAGAFVSPCRCSLAVTVTKSTPKRRWS